MISGNIPNILTIFRILLLPFFAASLLYENYFYAVILFVIASVTDFLDGLIARWQKQITRFGSILDPVADKFFLVSTFIILTVQGLVPIWLTITVISRDIIVVTGWVILSFVIQNPRVDPSSSGKFATALQFLLIGLVLLSLNISSGFALPMVFMVLVAVITGFSGVFYIYNGMKAADAEKNGGQT